MLFHDFGQFLHRHLKPDENIFVSLGLSASYDELRTDSSASSSLKKQKGEFTELAADYGFSYDEDYKIACDMFKTGGSYGNNDAKEAYDKYCN